MSSQDEKRPQRILSPSQVDTPQPVQPAPPAHLGERFRRMMQTPARRTDGSAGPAAPGMPGGKVLFANLSSLLASATVTKTSARGKEDDESPQPKNLRSNETSARRSHTESARAPLAASSSSQWSKGEEHTDTMLQNQAQLNDRIQAKASLQHWPEELTKAITTLCHRAGDQFTSWRVCVDLDQETLPQSELWLEASPQRLSLRFKTLSPLSFRLIFAHRDRLTLMLKEHLGSSRDVDIEIT
jgi:Type III secretion protein (HpaP)